MVLTPHCSWGLWTETRLAVSCPPPPLPSPSHQRAPPGAPHTVPHESMVTGLGHPALDGHPSWPALQEGLGPGGSVEGYPGVVMLVLARFTPFLTAGLPKTFPGRGTWGHEDIHATGWSK